MRTRRFRSPTDVATRVLDVYYVPDTTTVGELVAAINAAASGTGAIPSFDIADGETIVAELDGTDYTTGAIELSGYDNDFTVMSSGAFSIVMNYGVGSSASWDGSTLTVTFEPDVTTALELVNAINTASGPTASLVSDLPMAADFAPAQDNDGTGTIGDGEVVLATTYLTADGNSGAQATTGVIDPDGADNEFEIMAISTGSAYNGKRVTFYEVANAGDPVTAEWNGANTLTIRYEPGVSRAYEIVDAVLDLNIADPGSCPFTALLLGTGFGTIPEDGLADGPAYMTSGGTYADSATTGIINPAGINNAFEITSTTADPAYNGITVAFYHDANRASVSWNGLDTLNVYFVPGTTTINEIITRINNAGSPLTASLAVDPNLGGGVLTNDATGVIHDGAEFLIDGAYERVFTNQIVDPGTGAYSFFVPADALPGRNLRAIPRHRRRRGRRRRVAGHGRSGQQRRSGGLHGSRPGRGLRRCTADGRPRNRRVGGHLRHAASARHLRQRGQ